MKIISYLTQIDPDKVKVPTAPGGAFDVNSQSLTLGKIISVFLIYVIPLAGIALFIYLIFGGFGYLTAGGDPKKIQTAVAQITNALVGFLIIFASFWIVQIVGQVLGLGNFGGLF